MFVNGMERDTSVEIVRICIVWRFVKKEVS